MGGGDTLQLSFFVIIHSIKRTTTHKPMQHEPQLSLAVYVESVPQFYLELGFRQRSLTNSARSRPTPPKDTTVTTQILQKCHHPFLFSQEIIVRAMLNHPCFFILLCRPLSLLSARHTCQKINYKHRLGLTFDDDTNVVPFPDDGEGDDSVRNNAVGTLSIDHRCFQDSVQYCKR